VDDGVWTDPLAVLSYEKSDPTPLTQPGSTRQAHFAVLINPESESLPEVLYVPRRTIAITFTGLVYDGLRTDRFAGRAIAPLTTVDLTRPDGYYVTVRR
jgi:hypothetical protein